MASKKKTSGADQPAQDAMSSTAVAATAPPPADVAGQFVGQWNRLVSTTNWEKGRIICQWREALELGGAAVTDYSDEAWAQLVGGVTSQHVGRLRRVFQRFGAVFDQYEGLYWSHFQAALDWNDSEMWLEGAIRNDWSVSQMRGMRWETLGNAGDPPPDEAAAAQVDDDTAPPAGMAASAAMSPAAAVESAPFDAADDEPDDETAEASDGEDSCETAAAEPKSKTRKPLAVDVDDLPDDVADAFEQFKLAIIAQRRSGWRETTPAAVIECLDALKELALAPADD